MTGKPFKEREDLTRDQGSADSQERPKSAQGHKALWEPFWGPFGTQIGTPLGPLWDPFSTNVGAFLGAFAKHQQSSTPTQQNN